MLTIDLCKEIERWLESGDQLILGVDANEDVCTGPFSRSLQTLGLVKVITNKHGNEAPATYNRGSAPIDGLYVSSTLQGLRFGYLPFEFDH